MKRSFSLLVAGVALLRSAPAYAEEPPPEPVAPVAPSAPPAYTPLPFSPLLPPPPRAPRRSVWVHVESHHPVVLELLTPEETRWQRICEAPCDGEVPLDGVYRVSGHGLAPSRLLELEANPGDRVVVDVNARTYEQHRTGDHLILTSYIAGAVGLGLEIGALSVDASSPAQPALVWSGVGAAALAIACTISGYILLQPTGLSQSSVTAGAPVSRLPVWREVDPASRGAARVTNVPLFSTTF